MDGGVVKHTADLRYPEEACTLLVGFGAELGHLLYLAAGREGAVLLAVGDDVAGSGRSQPRDALQQ